MSSAKVDFYGKEVTDAIKKACDTLQVPQEELTIEVVETGSLGIFGIIRKKAHIRATLKGHESDPETGSQKEETEVAVPEKPPRAKAKTVKTVKTSKTAKTAKTVETVKTTEKEVVATVSEVDEKSVAKEEPSKQPVPKNPPLEIKPESMELVRQQLEELLKLMTFPSNVTAELDNGTIRCQVGDEFEEELTGQDGKIIDSLQYLLRKLAARKVEEKIRISIDIGEFREKRKVELMERAKALAALVKEDGKTQAIPPLNPSERRIVHVTLQDDKDIRSRSVGDGLFKKILIYKPGKGNTPGATKRGARGRRGKPSGAKKPQEGNDS